MGVRTGSPPRDEAVEISTITSPSCLSTSSQASPLNCVLCGPLDQPEPAIAHMGLSDGSSSTLRLDIFPGKTCNQIKAYSNPFTTFPLPLRPVVVQFAFCCIICLPSKNLAFVDLIFFDRITAVAGLAQDDGLRLFTVSPPHHHSCIYPAAVAHHAKDLQPPATCTGCDE